MINFTIIGLFLGFGVAQDTRPNIVFALVDDLGKTHNNFSVVILKIAEII